MNEQRDFDAAAAEWDEEPHRVRLAGEIADAIKAALPLTADWDAMDFGCGTGLVTLRLAPYLRSIVGVDSSRGMLDRLDAKIQAGGPANIRTSLAEELLERPSTARFHLITSAMTLHHIQDISTLLSSFQALLRPGGYVALADLETEDGSFHGDPTGVFHLGFSREELAELLGRAGFSSITIGTATEVVKGERHFPVLLASAVQQ
jgi:2-polyprenyl-3-methyl-5-hydroxy-6-metoxy-1,4-benzoquinol methylase